MAPLGLDANALTDADVARVVDLYSLLVQVDVPVATDRSVRLALSGCDDSSSLHLLLRGLRSGHFFVGKRARMIHGAECTR
jgi:hypothetical protein